MKWYSSEATHEVNTVQTDASPTTVFLRRNIHKETREEETGTYEVWVYEEAKVSHEEYEQILTEGLNAVTPYTASKTAYYGDTEAVFYDVPDGNMSVFVKDIEGNYPNYTVSKVGSTVTVSFEPLKDITTVIVSVIGK